MICIACHEEHPKLTNSHVISNFVRKRHAGIIREDGSKQYSFKWVGRPTLPRQDLPKPELMCRKCDSQLGAEIEHEIASLIMPEDVCSSVAWKELPIIAKSIEGVFDTEFRLGIYDYPLVEVWRIEKFSLLTAWRALHAMQKDGNPLSTSFLSSPRGQQIDNMVIDHLFTAKAVMLDGVHTAAFYYWSPFSVSVITGRDDEMPFAWTEVGVDGEFLGVAVMFGYWVVVWPLFECERKLAGEKLALLNRHCFLHWAGHVQSQLA